MRARRWLAAAALAAALLGLSGCDALGLPGANRPTPTATPAAPVAAPPPLDCAAFTTTAPVEALLGGPAPLATTPADALTTPAGLGPYAVQSAGGGWCRWGDDPAGATGAGGASAGAGSAGGASAAAASSLHALSVQLLPRAAASWQQLAQQYPDSAAMGAHYDGGESRGGDCAPATGGAKGGACHTNVLVGGSWLSVEAVAGTAAIDEKAFHALVQSFVPAAAAVDARAAAATPPAHATLPCGDAAWLTTIAGTFGTQTVSAVRPAQSFEVRSALLAVPGVSVCAYRAAGSRGDLGTVSVLRDAAAAYATYHAEVVATDPEASGGTVDRSGRPLATLVRHTDAAGSAPTQTIVDALAGDAWIQFAAQAGSDDEAASVVQWVAGRL